MKCNIANILKCSIYGEKVLVIKKNSLLRDLIQEQKSHNKTIALVATMGYLHAGHASLIKEAKKSCDIVIVSIFVNPLQFNVTSDLTNYPRDLDADSILCENMNADVIFAPENSEMYPNGAQYTNVIVNQMDKNLCGRTRPGHFLGVCTIVSKLFNLIQPDIAFFGKKDIQQLRIIETMVKELNFPIKVVGCDTVRDFDGLALSSRNKHLLKSERSESVVVPNMLNYILNLIKQGESRVTVLLEKGKAFLNQCEIAKLDYLEIVDYTNLQLLDKVEGHIIVATAVFIGKARLIDNVVYKIE